STRSPPGATAPPTSAPSCSSTCASRPPSSPRTRRRSCGPTPPAPPPDPGSAGGEEAAGEEVGEVGASGEREDRGHVLVGAHHDDGAVARDPALVEDVGRAPDGRAGGEHLLPVDQAEGAGDRPEHG